MQNFAHEAERAGSLMVTLAAIMRPRFEVVKDGPLGTCPNGCLTRFYLEPGKRCWQCNAPMTFDE